MSAFTAEQTALYAPFLKQNFDCNAWANSVLANESASEVGSALSRLNGSVDELNRQLRSEITANHSKLLTQAAAISTLNESLGKVRGGLSEVENGVARLRAKIALPYDDLSKCITRLERLQKAAIFTRRAARMVQLARRLELQMKEFETTSSRDRALAEAALSLSEIENLKQELDNDEDLSFRSVSVLEPHLDAIDTSREIVTSEMEDMVRQGLGSLNQETLASSLQTAANLSILPSMVASLVTDLTEAMETRIRSSFDMHSLAREMAAKDGSSSNTSSFVYKSRARTEPTNATMPQWTSTFWSRLENLIQDMADCCTKVYLLERVLELKKDSSQQRSFLSICLQSLDNRPSLIFWTTLASSFEAQCKDLIKSSSFAQQVLGQGYPTLLRLFQEFFTKVALHTDTVYNHVQQSPETVLLLRAVLPFENLYLAKSNSRLNEAVASASQGGTRSPPGANDGLLIARTFCNELDSARFDPLLVRSVARNVARAMDLFLSRVSALVANDYAAISLLGPSSPPSQLLNAELVNALYYFWHPINRAIETDYTVETSVPDIVAPLLQKARSSLFDIISPLLTAIKRELSNIIARIHRSNFENLPTNDSGSSSCMKDLGEKLTYIRTEVLGVLRVGTLAKEWAIDLARFLIRQFILHASIVHPLSEDGKLKLVSDLTSLEFAVSQLLSDYKLGLNALGEDFTNLRAFRPLLFVETSELSDAKQINSIPILPLLHHILVRSPIPLPHRTHGWSESEYVKWINEHSEEDHLKLIQDIIARNENSEDGQEFLDLLKNVLSSRSR